ncbi:hypothetical protein [Thiomicrospira microaerophila]|uniref:hypothetical protein n=1 Tax=Thiomicrospira microaerophila TaxID=406020 RepID=UPI001E5460DD|nr:hypothetical protein [Thiomicrospira microaerophila]
MMSSLSASRGMNDLDENGYSAASVRCVLFKLGTEVYGINVKKYAKSCVWVKFAKYQGVTPRSLA